MENQGNETPQATEEQFNQDNTEIASEEEVQVTGEETVETPSEDVNTSTIKPINQADFDVKVRFNQGMLRISVPEEMIGEELSVYNLMGQLLFQTKMSHTEEMFHLYTNSNFYIVVLQSGNTFISKKVFAK